MGTTDGWRRAGLISPAQAERIDEIESGRLFSVHRELRALLYLGVLLLIAGIGATVARRFNELGEPAIVGSLALAVAASWGWCFRRAAPYSPGKVSQPSAALDYLLYLGCALLGVLFTYLETRHRLLGPFWNLYLLASALLFGAFAYRFDNRLVLSLALIDAAAWWGVSLDRWGLAAAGWRASAFAFGAAAVAAGFASERAGVKAHFRETYLTVGANALFWSALPGALDRGFAGPGLYVVLALSAAAVFYARRSRRFEYFLYGVGYGYVAAARAVVAVLPGVWQLQALFFIVSAGAVVAFLLLERRHFLQEAA